jgi:uncharacterized tellurite resistance protein B-like protein
MLDALGPSLCCETSLESSGLRAARREVAALGRDQVAEGQGPPARLDSSPEGTVGSVAASIPSALDDQGGFTVSILQRFGWGPRETGPAPRASDPAETETVRKIVERLDRMEPDRARFVAAFGYVLSRVAGADMQITETETRAMERILVDHAGLPEEQAVIVVQMAKHQNLLFGGTENYLVTRELAKLSSHEQKIALLECLFAVSAADESISSVEDRVIRQISDQLRLEHRDFIEARSKYRDYLAVLRKGVDPKP